MKTSKEEIVMTSLRLFAERGFDAVSTSMIAGELGITKGALYRHFTNKLEIFDCILKKMYELDEQRAQEDSVPAKEFSEDAESYETTEIGDFVEFVNNQFLFWTEDPFASNFRKMITLEQFRNAEMTKLYQNVIAIGPVKYTADIFFEMIKSGKLNNEAKEYGAWNLAVDFYAPLQLMIQLSDGGADKEMLRRSLRQVTEEFEKRWINRV